MSLALTVLVGAGAAVLLAIAAGLPPDGLRVLFAAGALVVAGMTLALGRWMAAEARRLREMTAAIRRISRGDIHVYVPVARDSDAGTLADAVNRLVDQARSRRLTDETERTLDRAMLREAPNGLLVTDGHGRIRRTNPAVARLMPVHGDPVGKPPIDTIPVVELQEALEEAARTRAVAERHARVGARDLQIRAFPLADGVGCLGVVLDLSSVVRAERARRDFVSNVSHELRTPITALIGYAEVLIEDRADMPPHAVPMLEAIDRNARRLGALIEDVLSLSRIEAREGDLALEAEPLRPLIEEVMERFVGRALQRNVRLELASFPEVEPLVNAEAFEHALGNLVDNALKYTHAGGRVALTVEIDADSASVSVSDDGVGIDPLHHERIFERFYRVDGGRGRDVGGTGLGLALVKHLCKATRSEVTLRSAPGEGSTFTLRLPLPDST